MVKYSQDALKVVGALGEYLSAHYNERKPYLSGDDLRIARNLYKNPEKLLYSLQGVERELDSLKTTAEKYVTDGAARLQITASINGYLAQIHEFEKEAQHNRLPNYVYLLQLARNLPKLIDSVKQSIQRKHGIHATATVVIVILSMIGLASFLYTQSEPTARVVSPTVSNLPLGIAFLAILIIAVIAISSKK